MMNLKIKDNTRVHQKEFDVVSHLTKRIANKTLDQLSKEDIFVFPELLDESDDISKNQMILQSINDKYQTGNIMGFLGFGSERLNIESRFSKGEHDYLFQYLLERVVDYPNILELSTNANSDSSILNIYAFLFPSYLKKAMRKGIYKEYTKQHYNDSSVKGTIDVSRHIKENTPFTGKVSYNQREFSYDNYLMELIRHTVEYLRKKSYGDTILKNIRSEINTVVRATENYQSSDRQKIIIQNKKNSINHAYYYEYRKLQRLCIMILQQEKLQIASGDRSIFGVLFDGAWLWEEYVNTIISEQFYHPMNKAGKGAERLFATETGKVGLIYPDFIGKDKMNRVVADAKYKPISNIGNKDYLQVLAYMFRFDAKCGIYIYPEVNSTETLKLKLNKGLRQENSVSARDDVKVTKCGMLIPQDVSNYNDFSAKMVMAEQELLKNLSSITGI